MARLRKFISLPPAEQWLLIRSLFLVCAIRLGLWILPFRTVRRLLATTTKRSRMDQITVGKSQFKADRIGWAVAAASCYVPDASCLVQALAAHTTLKRYGHPASLHVGVAKGEQGNLTAHAWVASQGKIVVGGASSPFQYTPLPPIEQS